MLGRGEEIKEEGNRKGRRGAGSKEGVKKKILKRRLVPSRI